jgi:hypothetical protein
MSDLMLYLYLAPVGLTALGGLALLAVWFMPRPNTEEIARYRAQQGRHIPGE